MIDYDTYILTLKMKVFYSTMASFVIFSATYLFYRSILISAVLCPLGVLYIKFRREQLIAKRRSEVNIQFKDLLISLASSLSSGKAIENSFENALNDLSMLYQNDDTCIIKETKIIIHKLSLNITIEDAMADFANRTKIEDIKNFTEVIIVCKRTGGNLIEAIRNSSAIISDKIEIKQEIETLLSARKLEQKILNVMPIGIIIVLSVTAQEYIEPVFNTIQGRMYMTVCIILLFIAFIISNKIMNIKM